MIHPAPTTKIDPTLARGTVVEVQECTETNPAKVVLSFPNNSYKTVLEIDGDIEPLRSKIGEMVVGRIYADARRVDVPNAGGRRIDPCLGPPRRVMGTVIGYDPVADVLVIDAGAPIVLNLLAQGQEAGQFADAEFVSCDVLPGARFALHG